VVFCVGLTIVYSFKQFVLDPEGKRNEREYHIHLGKKNSSTFMLVIIFVNKCFIVEAIS